MNGSSLWIAKSTPVGCAVINHGAYRCDCCAGCALCAVQICYGDYLIGETYTTDGCGHRFCVSCMMRYCEARVEVRAVEISCPDPDCEYLLSHAEARGVDVCAYVWAGRLTAPAFRFIRSWRIRGHRRVAMPICANRLIGTSCVGVAVGGAICGSRPAVH